MSTRIEQRLNASSNTVDHGEENVLQAATQLNGGGPEEMMAMAMIMLDRTAEVSREARREEQRAQQVAIRAQVDEMLDQASFKFASSCSQAAGNAASGALTVASAGAASEKAATTLTGYAEIVSATGTRSSASFDLAAGRSAAAQTISSDINQSHRERANEHGDDVRDARQRADRAMQHIQDLSNARAQGQMAAARG